MTTFVAVETLDFADAARRLAHEVGDPVAGAAWRLGDTLSGCAAMSGSDPGGQEWAAAYDSAAGPAVRAVADIASGAYRVAMMFAQTARNYEHAEAASSARSRAAMAAAISGLPWNKIIEPGAAPPSAVGGSGSAPTGWSFVASRVGLWPDGHQDRLRRAGNAWRHAASVLSDAGFSSWLAEIGFDRDRLPEADDVSAVCKALSARTRRLATTCAALGDACHDLAQHIDTVHGEIRSELIKLGIESGAIQVGGAILSTVSFGAAEVPTQGAQAARIVAVAAAVARLIEKFVAAARLIAARVCTHVEDLTRLAQELHAVRELRIVSVSVQGVGPMPAVVRVREASSMARMAGEAASAPDAMLAQARGRAFIERLAADDSPLDRIAPENRWASPQTLSRHYKEHGGDIGAKSADDYVSKAADFLQRAIREHLPTKIDAHGNIRIWDPGSKVFASFDKDGLCRTIFRETRLAYFDRQDGVSI